MVRIRSLLDMRTHVSKLWTYRSAAAVFVVCACLSVYPLFRINNGRLLEIGYSGTGRMEVRYKEGFFYHGYIFMYRHNMDDRERIPVNGWEFDFRFIDRRRPPGKDFLAAISYEATFILLCLSGLLCWLRSRSIKANMEWMNGLCPTCSYDLRAHAPGQRCPECGTLIPHQSATILSNWSTP